MHSLCTSSRVGSLVAQESRVRNLLTNNRGQSGLSHVLVATLVGALAITSFSELGGAYNLNLTGAAQAQVAQTPSLTARIQAAVSTAARAAYRAARAVTDAIADAGKVVDATESGRLVQLVAEAKRLAEEAGYVTILRIADETADSPLAVTLLRKERIDLVEGSLSTKQFDIFTLDQAKRPDGTPVRVLADDDGHYLFGLSEGKVPDFYNASVEQDLVRTTLLTSLDRIEILNQESAQRLARRLSVDSELSAADIEAMYRPRLGPWAPENVVEGAANNAGSRLKVKPQFTTAIARGSGLDMNAFSATGGNSRPHLAMGAYADRNGRLYSTALTEGIVWHEWGHANTDGMRPEYRYPGYIKNGDPDYQLEDIPDFLTRHGRKIEPRELEPAELGTRLFFARALHEWRSDLQARTGAMHDPTIIKKFIEATGGDMRIREGNPIRELALRFAEDLGIDQGGLRGSNPAETIPEALRLQGRRGQPNPYDFAVVMKRWEEDAVAVLYEQKLLELAEEADDINVINDPNVIARALEAASDDFLDLSKWALMHELMDEGPDFGRYAALMVQGAAEGTALDGPAPELAQALLQSAIKRGIVHARPTPEGLQLASATELGAMAPALLEAMGSKVPPNEGAARLREAAGIHDHRMPIQ